MELAKITINDFGGAPIADHNMPCAVCLKNPGVYNLSAHRIKSGTFDPCWECQEKGWRLVNKRKLPRVLRWLLPEQD